MLTVFLHGAVGNWDEILFIAIGVLFILTFLVVLFRGRQFAPVLEDSEDADSQPEEPTPHPTRRPKPGKKNR
ncbi:MAG: hypothetical protein KC418_20300 [Anaerolineales bacterium]|nr:hypothetical protein [Anaerolineales bacterium]MCB8951682.1 hypothetical protein [Ardenticatenales bacterium]